MDTTIAKGLIDCFFFIVDIYAYPTWIGGCAGLCDVVRFVVMLGIKLWMFIIHVATHHYSRRLVSYGSFIITHLLH